MAKSLDLELLNSEDEFQLSVLDALLKLRDLQTTLNVSLYVISDRAIGQEDTRCHFVTVMVSRAC